MTAVTRTGTVQTPASARTDGTPRRPRSNRFDVPALRAQPGGFAARFATRFGNRHPAVVFLAALLLGFAVVAALSVGIGEFVNKVLLPAAGIGRADESVNVWLAEHRSTTLTDASSLGSTLGGAPLLPILAGVIALTFAALRQWRLAGYAALGLAVESALYRLTTLSVPRHRPDVPRLDSLPVNASYPSGHTAASVVVYAGIALLVTSGLTRRSSRALAWSAAATMALFVAGSRLYRGMHHPIDVLAGALLGLAALVVLVWACRAAGACAAARARASGTSAEQ